MCQNRQWFVVAKILTSEDSDFLLSLFIQEMNHTSCGWDLWIFIGKTYATKFVGTYYELSVGPSVWYCGPLLPAGARRIKRRIWMVGSAVGHGGSGLVGLWAGGPSNDVNELGQWTGQQRRVEPALVPPSTRPRTIINRRRRISAA